jgi:GNAT superfamily N-acetyltransferase
LELAQVTLRPEVAGDEVFLRDLYLSTRDDEVGFRDLDPAARTAWLQQQCEWQHAQYRAAWPQGWFSIVTVGARPAGRFYVAQQGTDLLVIDLSLLPEYRGHGIGTQLMKSVQAEAVRTGGVVQLHVAQGSVARGFYARLGFEVVGGAQAHVRMEWRGNPGQGKR